MPETQSDPSQDIPLWRDPNLRLCFGVTLMVVMGVVSLAPAFPDIMRELALTEAELSWLVTMFTLPGIVLAPLVGIGADRYGRKRLLVPALWLYGVAGGACGLTTDYSLLLVLRLFQGMGAATFAILAITIVSDLYEGPRRATALGLNAGVLSLGVAMYPLIGGALAALHWRAPFFLPLLALPLALAVQRGLHAPEPTTKEPMGVYVRTAFRAMRSPQVFLLFASTAVIFVILYGPFLTFFPLLLARSFGVSAPEIGGILAGPALITALVASQLGRLASVVGERALLTAAFVAYALASASLALIPSVAWTAVPVLLLGVGQGLSMPSIQSLLAQAAPERHRAGFMAVNGLALRLGQTVGPLFMGVMFALFDLAGVFWAGAAVSLAMFLVCLLVPRR